MAECKHKLGLVVLRNCNKEAALQCEKCGKPVCREHCIDNLCLECAAYEHKDKYGKYEKITRETDRRDFYLKNDYDPIYGRTHYQYGAHDYHDTDLTDESDFDDFETGDIELSDYDFQDS